MQFLIDVGLEYLTLSRSAASLSGGESQRIRLATQIGSHLTGVLYVLDEPSIGLHQRDNARLIKALKEMRDLGNTLIVVEHDEEIMMQADFWLISALMPVNMAAKLWLWEHPKKSWLTKTVLPDSTWPRRNLFRFRKKKKR